MDLSDIKTKVFETLINIACDDEKKVWLWNGYCIENDKTEDEVYFNDYESLNDNEVLESIRPGGLLRMAFYGKYNYEDEFCYINRYGNLVSSSDIDKTPYDNNELAEYMCDYFKRYDDWFDITDLVDAIIEVGEDMFTADNYEIEEYIQKAYKRNIECLLDKDFNYEQLFKDLISEFPHKWTM